MALTEVCFPAVSRAITAFLAHLGDQAALLASLGAASTALRAAADEVADPREVAAGA